MGNPFTALDGGVSFVQFRGLGGGDWLDVKRGVGEGAGEGIGEDFQEMGHGRKLAGVELIEHLMSVFFHIRFLLFRRYSVGRVPMREHLTNESSITSNAL